MKTSLIFLSIAMLSLGFRLPAAAQNLVVNGDFETRNALPQTLFNAGPVGTVGNTFYADDLPDWNSVQDANSTNSAAYNRACYVATDGISPATPAHYGGTAHAGNGCVRVYQHNATSSHSYDAFVTQQLTLIPGHRYLAQFWANRVDYSAFHSKVSLYVTDGTPTYGYNGTSYDFTPSTGSKVVTSNETYAPTGWFLVSGYITIPAGQSSNQWLTIGPARFNQYYEPAPWSNAVDPINYLIDDVSIVDAGCPTADDFAVQYVSGPSACYGNRCYYSFSIFNPFGWSYRWSRTGLYNDQSVVIGQGTPDPMIPRPNPSTAPTVYCVFHDPSGNCDDVAVYVPVPGGGGLAKQQGGQTIEQDAAYPNPTSESLTLPAGTTDAVLLSSQGKAVQRPDGTGKLDVHSLPAGLYNLRMQQNGKMVNQHIEVKH